MEANCIKDKYIVNKHSLEPFALMETVLYALSLPDTTPTPKTTPSSSP